MTPRLIPRNFPAFLALLIAALLPAALRAEPYLAIGKGRKCSACHVNCSGGGERTRYGVTFGTTSLPWRPWPAPAKAERLQRFLSTGDAGPLRLGGDFEFADLTVFPSGSGRVTNELSVGKARLYASWEPDRKSVV